MGNGAWFAAEVLIHLTGGQWDWSLSKPVKFSPIILCKPLQFLILNPRSANRRIVILQQKMSYSTKMFVEMLAEIATCFKQKVSIYLGQIVYDAA